MGEFLEGCEQDVYVRRTLRNGRIKTPSGGHIDLHNFRNRN
jgi:hypothetical protein